MKRVRRTKTVPGISAKTMIPKKANITVQMTCDDIGQSLSLTDGKTMLMIPLEKVRNIIVPVLEEEGRRS